MRVQEVHNREGDSPLHTAIRDDNNDLVKKLLKKKSDLCIKNAAGITPLHLICALGRDKLLTNVLAYAKKQIAKNSEDNQYTKIDLTVQDNQGNTPLHYAMIQPTDHILAIIKRFDSVISYDLSITNHQKRTVLHVAAGNPKETVCLSLLQWSVMTETILNQQDQLGLTGLHFAVLTGKESSAKHMLDAKADPNISAFSTEMSPLLPNSTLPPYLTPLWMALELGRYQFISLLVRPNRWPHLRGLNTGEYYLKQTTTTQGQTAIHLAAMHGWDELLDKWISLFSLSTVIDFQDSHGKKPIHYAAQAGQVSTIQFLVNKGASLYTKDTQGNQPLHHAAEAGQNAVVKWIADKSGSKPKDLKSHNNLKQSPYRLAHRKDKLEVMEILTLHKGQDDFDAAQRIIKAGTVDDLEKFIDDHPDSVNATDEDDMTLLDFTILLDNKNTNAMVSLLIEKGAPVKHEDVRGVTALHHAAATHNVRAINNLLTAGVNVDHVTIDGATPLHYTVLRKHTDDAMLRKQSKAFAVLVNHKADFNRSAHPSLLHKLFNSNTEMTPQPTPLWLAHQFDVPDLIKKIVKYKSKKNQKIEVDSTISLNGDSLLHYFARRGEQAEFEKVVMHTSNPFAKNQAGLSPVHVAAQLGHIGIIRHMVENIALNQGFVQRKLYGSFDIEDKTREGETAWLLAKAAGQTKVMQYLESKGCQKLEKPEPARGIFQKVREICETQSKLGAELKNTATFQNLNTLRTFVPILTYYYAGPVTTGLQLTSQILLYSSSSVMRCASWGYYRIKPTVHNHMFPLVEQVLDSTAAAVSTTANIALTGFQIFDYATNPSRRITGDATSYLLANMAASYTNNKEVQGGFFIVGRELGMLAVDAYQGYKPQDASSDTESFDHKLNQGLTIWSSLLGKENGEWFVYNMHSLMQVKDSLYFTFGAFEHGVVQTGANYLSVLSSFESYQQLEAALQSASNLLSPYQATLAPAYVVLTKAQNIQKEASYWRDILMYDMEQWIYDNAIPEGEYRDYATFYVQKAKLELLLNQVLEAELEKSKADMEQQSGGSQEQLESTSAAYEALIAKFEAQQKICQDAWHKTPKGFYDQALKTAQFDEIQTRIAFDEASTQCEFIKKYPHSQEELDAANKAVAETELAWKAAVEKTLEAEAAFVSVLNSLEKTQFEKDEILRKETVDKMVEDLHQQNTNILEMQLTYSNTETELLDAKINLENTKNQYLSVWNSYQEIQKIIYIIDHPAVDFAQPGFSPVYDALHQEDTSAEAVTAYLINKIVATGIISYPDAVKMMQSSFMTAQSGSKDKIIVHLNKRFQEFWAYLKGEYRSNLVAQGNTLYQKVQTSKSNVQKAEQNVSECQSKTDKAKEDYLNALPAENRDAVNQIIMQSAASNETALWNVAHPAEQIKQILSIVGQPNAMMEAGLYANQGVIGNQYYTSYTIAQWLISYKYLFLTPPSAHVQKNEIDALATKFQGGKITAQELSQEKTAIDQIISSVLLQNAMSSATLTLGSETDPKFSDQVAENVVINLQRVFHGDTPEATTELTVNGQPLTGVISKAVSGNNLSEATNGIASVLQNSTTEISLKEFGDCTPAVVNNQASPAPTAPVPKQKRHGLDRFVHGAIGFVESAVSYISGQFMQQSALKLNNQGVGLQLPDYNEIPLYTFNAPKKPPLFTVPNAQASNAPVYMPPVPIASQPLTTATASNRSASGTGTIVPLSSIPRNSASTDPVLPVSTFMPSLATSSTAVPLRVPETTFPKALIFSNGPTNATSASSSSSAASSSSRNVVPFDFQRQVNIDMRNSANTNAANPQPPKQGVMSKIGEALLTMVVGGKAEAFVPVLAVPYAVETAAILGAAGVAYYQQRQNTQAHDPNELDGHLETYPIADPLPNMMLGPNPLLRPVDDNIETFPITERGPSVMFGPNPSTRPVDNRPLTGPTPFTLPILQPLALLYSYFQSGRNSGSTNTSTRIYDNNYPKHKPNNSGTGAAWSGASVNPIPNKEIGQKLLDTAYPHPTKDNQLFHYYDGKVIKFRNDGQGNWHAYEIPKEVKKNTPNKVLNAFLKDKLISESEYKQLLKK